MSRDPYDPPRRYETTVGDVREVSLSGAADLQPWTELLAGEGLVPYRKDGRTDVLIVACAGRFLGVRFRELSICVAISRSDLGLTRDGVYLAHAYNSVRLFAFIERAAFRAPYFKAEVSVETSPRASMAAAERGRVLLRAEMDESAGRTSEEEDGGWEGVVFLPRQMMGGHRPGKFFYAKLRGPTRSRAFSPSMDRFELSPEQHDRILRLLATSHFAGTEWQIREDAVHSKSKSYARH